MTMTIARIFAWDAAHRILGHESKCKHLHGHRYTAEVVMTAADLDPLGRVIDFGVIKTLIGNWIDEWWDHNILLHPNDPLLNMNTPNVGGFCLSPAQVDEVFGGKAPFVMPDGRKNPTAENIAAVLYCVASRLVTGYVEGVRVIRVRVWETPNCFAEYSE